MSIIESAKAHFREKLSGGLRELEVPEWPDKDGNPYKIYYKAGLNFLQQEKILALSDQGKKAEAIVEAFIQRALDADGKPLFRTGHRIELMRSVDPDVISRLVGEMSQADDLDVDEITKN